MELVLKKSLTDVTTSTKELNKEINIVEMSLGEMKKAFKRIKKYYFCW